MTKLLGEYLLRGSVKAKPVVGDVEDPGARVVLLSPDTVRDEALTGLPAALKDATAALLASAGGRCGLGSVLA